MKCTAPCATCLSLTQCLSCLNGRNLVRSKCLCLKGFYEDPVDKICKKCSFKCKSFSSPESCDECPEGLQEIVDPGGSSNKLICGCPPQSYQTDTCINCPKPCIECTKKQCTICPSNLLPVVDRFACECTLGTYYNQTSCVTCPFPCSTCI